MHLLPLTDAHFAWLMDEAAPPADAPALPPGGLETPAIIALLRSVARTVGGAIGGTAAWMMVVDDEAVGIVSVKERDAAGRWDIGYGIAPSRRGRGHAIAAVAALKPIAQARGTRGLTAETLPDSGASPRVLTRNGFACIGQFDHPEDGLVDQWLVEWAQ